MSLLVGVGRHTGMLRAVTVWVAVGLIIGFALSRDLSLPNCTEAQGNWTQPLALMGLVAELTLLVPAAAVLVRSRPTTVVG